MARISMARISLVRIPLAHALRACLLLAAFWLTAGTKAAWAEGSGRGLEFLEAVTWGATQASYDELHRLGRKRWLERQLAMPPAPLPPPLQEKIEALKVSTTSAEALAAEALARLKVVGAMPPGDERRAALLVFDQGMGDIVREAAMRTVLRALYAPDQLRERMTWFWFNHFNVHAWKSNLRLLVGDFEERAIRPNALGRFRDLLGATLRHPAMLRYLDNADNTVGRRNENYARELLELHTLGIDGGYSQKDVEELARILTGFGLDPGGPPPRLSPERAAQYRREGGFLFNPALHDYGDKLFLGHVIKGRGEAEADEVLDILAAHPATARHVSRKLATYFMADDPPEQVVDAMAREFLRSDGSIPAVLRVLLESPEFDRAAGTRPKDAVRFVFSALRLAYEEKQILNAAPAISWLFLLGEGLYNRQEPDGYSLASPDWTGPGQMTTRFEVARAIGSGPVGLFRVAGEKVDRPGFPVIRNALFYAAWQARLRPATRAALDQAISPQDWNTLFLSSPEFMQGGAPP